MKYKIFIFAAVSLAASVSFAQDISVTNTFANGQRANAEEVNQNFQDLANGINTNKTAIDSTVNGIDQRVTTIESRVRPNSDYLGFGMPFSASGQPRNVILLRRDYNDGTTGYSLRMRYANSDNETITINGSEQQFAYFAEYGFVSVDESNEILGVSKTIDGMNDTSYTSWSHMRIGYDPISLEGFLDDRSYEAVDTYYGQGPLRNITRYRTNYDTNTGIVSNDSELLLRHYALSTGYQANGIDFGDTPIRIEYRSYGASRIRVQGVGIVEMFGGGDSPSLKIIYYNVNGQTGGSLAGTPFESGSAIRDIFF